jgi:hypothetical protein
MLKQRLHAICAGGEQSFSGLGQLNVPTYCAPIDAKVSRLTVKILSRSAEFVSAPSQRNEGVLVDVKPTAPRCVKVTATSSAVASEEPRGYGQDSAGGQPDPNAVAHQHLIGPPVGKEIGMVGLCRTEDGDDPRQGGLACPRAYPWGGRPTRFD